MNLRTALFLFLAFFTTNPLFAQDTIYTIKGLVIEARVKSRNVFAVTYYNSYGGDTALQWIPGSQVLRIAYSDGRTWAPRPAHNQRRLEQKLALGNKKKYVRQGYPNLITLNFPQFHSINGLIGLAGGIGYERYLNKSGTLSAGIPLYYLQGTNGSSGDLKGIAFYKTCYGYYIIPGLHYHPLGNTRKNDLSIGLGCMSGVFYVTEHFNKNGLEQSQSTNPIGLLGFMGQIIYRVHISKHAVFGLELGYGRTTSNGLDDFPPLFNLGLKLGGRF